MPYKDRAKRRAAVRASHAKARALAPDAIRESERERKAEQRERNREHLRIVRQTAMGVGHWSPKADKLFKEIQAAYDRLPDIEAAATAAADEAEANGRTPLQAYNEAKA